MALRKDKEQEAKAMVGLRVRIAERVQRLKQGVPAGPLQIRAVTRKQDRLGFTLSGLDARGEQIEYKDWFPMSEDLTKRYIRTDGPDVAPHDPESYASFFRSSTAAGKRAEEEVYREPASALEIVMPLYQFEQGDLQDTTIRRLGNGGLADLQCLLASDCRPFHSADSKGTTIWRASTVQGVHFDSSDEALRKQVCSLLSVRYTRDEVMSGRWAVPEAMRTAAGTPLHPWQAWMYAEFQNMMRNKTAAEKILLARTRGGRGCVQGIATRPERISVLVAEPGEGKTRVGALCAFDLPTLVVAVRGTLRHWVREAGLVGVKAFQVGAGGKSPLEAKAVVQEEAGQKMWIMTREGLGRLANKHALSELPAPKLIIVDEFHTPLLCLKRLMQTWPGVVVLGLTGTFHRDKVGSVAYEIGWDADVLEAAVVRVPRCAQGGTFPSVEVWVKRVNMTKLEKACYEAGKAWMTQQEKQQILIFSPPEGRDAEYGADLWSTIVVQLQRAEQDVRDRLGRLLKHVLSAERRQALAAQIAEELGEEATRRIQAASDALPDVVTAYGPAEVRSNLAAAFEKRSRILGSYLHVTRQLDTVAAGSEIDCPVCYDKTKEWSISQCGHLVCVACSGVRELHERCHTCRRPNPAWKSATELARLRSPDAEDNEKNEFGKATNLDTSSKLKGLASILFGLDRSDRALVVAPGPLLRAVASEMERVGIKLGVMAGAGAQQERTLAAWSRGHKHYKGLLCPPTILGVDLPEATTIIFLTDVIPTDDFKQALARVVRQGNATVEKGIPVKVWFVVYRGTEEEDEETLQSKIELARASAGERRG